MQVTLKLKQWNQLLRPSNTPYISAVWNPATFTYTFRISVIHLQAVYKKTDMCAWSWVLYQQNIIRVRLTSQLFFCSNIYYTTRWIVLKIFWNPFVWKIYFRFTLLRTANSLFPHSTVLSADAAHLLSLKVVCIKNRAKPLNSVCWQTVDPIVS
jgi:hypothetical protein